MVAFGAFLVFYDFAALDLSTDFSSLNLIDFVDTTEAAFFIGDIGFAGDSFFGEGFFTDSGLAGDSFLGDGFLTDSFLVDFLTDFAFSGEALDFASDFTGDLLEEISCFSGDFLGDLWLFSGDFEGDLSGDFLGFVTDFLVGDFAYFSGDCLDLRGDLVTDCGLASMIC